MCAEEIREPRDFWINEYSCGDGTIWLNDIHETELAAFNQRSEIKTWNWTRTIHVREVMEGE